MAPKKKKSNRTGYYYYMMEVWDDFEIRLGRRPNMDELKELAGPGWLALTKDEKEQYNVTAKQEKSKAKEDGATKYNSLGIPFATLDAEEREKQEEANIMKATIRSIVFDPPIESLKTVRFYVSHVNWYYRQFIDQEFRHCPCEIAIIEFSIQDGITRKFHKILDPGVLPLGVRANVKEHAEAYTDIYISSRLGKPDPPMEKNMQTVFQDVIEFLRRGGIQGKQGREILPPVFTMPNSVSLNHSLTAVKDALQKFREASHERRDLFRVFPLPQLLFDLKVRCDPGFKSEYGSAIIETELDNDSFYGTGYFECEYHLESEKGAHCSQSIATRWTYIVLDHICSKVGVELIPGKHCPEGTVARLSAQDLWGVDNVQESISDMNINNRAATAADQWAQKQKIREANIQKARLAEEQVKQAEKLPLPSSLIWKDVPSGTESDDGWTSVPSRSRGPQNPRGWNTVAGSGMTADFPASSGFPDLASGAQHRGGSSRQWSDASGDGNTKTEANTPKRGYGRGKMFQ